MRPASFTRIPFHRNKKTFQHMYIIITFFVTCYIKKITIPILEKLYGKDTVNKRPMGHITHLRNQFKSINTFAKSYNYIITLIWRTENQLSPFLLLNGSYM